MHKAIQARILKKSEEHLWEKFLRTHPLATVHQTPAWGHFQAKIPDRGKYWIIVIEELGGMADGTGGRSPSKIIAGTLLVRHKLPRNYCWFYAPRGPLLNSRKGQAQKQMDILLKIINPLSKEENAIFLRIDPPHQTSRRQPSEPPKFKNFHTSSFGFQPEHTLILDLAPPLQTILDQMKPKGRYNIRLAEKKGVQTFRADSKNLNKFYEILRETTNRDAFHAHEEDFYRNMLETLAEHRNAELYLAKYRQKTLAGIIVTYYKDTATYYYGASGNEHRNLMAPYLLQWHAIKDAKERGCRYYDFFGIAPAHAKNHPWQGVTEFKKKFGGQEVSYAPPQEHSFKKILHFLYDIYKKLKK